MKQKAKEFPSTKGEAARLLAQQGEAANRETGRRFTELRKRFPDPPLFSLSVAAWLAECFPLKAEEGFFRTLFAYMEEDGEEPVLAEYGSVPLFSEAATLWRVILITQDASAIADDFSATDIWLYQEIVLNAAGLLGARGIPKGIGPWLFLGPFKILAAWKPQRWGSVETENLLYPIAGQELAALAYFKRQGANWLGQNIDRILKIEEQSFSLASATVTMAQDIQKELARTAPAYLIHINAGLRALGASLSV